MTALQEKHIRTLDGILGKEISGTFFLRNELQEFMPNDEISQLIKRIERLYEQGKLKNNGRSYNPKYRVHRLLDADTVFPKAVFQVLIPGNHVHQGEVVGEVILSVLRGEHGEVTFVLPEESPATKLVREQGWKSSDEEIKALDALIAAARDLQKFGNRNFPVTVEVGKDGVQVSAKYADPMAAVRLALAG